MIYSVSAAPGLGVGCPWGGCRLPLGSLTLAIWSYKPAPVFPWYIQCRLLLGSLTLAIWSYKPAPVFPWYSRCRLPLGWVWVAPGVGVGCHWDHLLWLFGRISLPLYFHDIVGVGCPWARHRINASSPSRGCCGLSNTSNDIFSER